MTGRLLQMSGVIVDLIYEVETVPTAGEEATVTGFSIAPGGAFNAMVAAKRAGMDVTYGGTLGTGPFADITRQGLAEAGIPSLRNPIPFLDQGCSTVLVDRNGERTFIAKDGADGHATAEALAAIDSAAFDWVLLSGYALYYAESRDAFQSWLSQDNTIPNLVFDPSPMVADIPAPVRETALQRARWISANAQEAGFLTGKTEPADAAAALAAERPASGGAIVRMGAKGCIVSTGGKCQHVAGFPVEAIDTTGAGDAHLGNFIARLDAGDDPFEAARYANVAAALSTTKKGPATGPEKDAVLAAINDHEAGSADSKTTTDTMEEHYE